MTPHTASKKKRHSKTTDPLIARFFHSFDIKTDSVGPPRREIAWQGGVVEKRLRGHYLVQLFDWLSGEPSDQLLVHRYEMTGWQFYDSDAEMRDHYEGYASRLLID